MRAPDAGGRAGGGTSGSGSSAVPDGSAGLGRSRTAASTAAGSRAGAAGLEGGDASLDGCVDLVDALLGNVLSDGGDLGDNGRAEGGAGLLLLLQSLNGDRGDAELVEVGLLGGESVNGALDGGDEVAGGVLEAQSLHEAKGFSALDLLGSGLDDRLDVGGGRQNRSGRVGIGSGETVDGGGEVAEGALHRGDGLLDGRELGNGTAGQKSLSEDDERQLHVGGLGLFVLGGCGGCRCFLTRMQRAEEGRETTDDCWNWM